MASESKGLRLTADARAVEGAVEVKFRLRSEQDYVLHWGLQREKHRKAWQSPPQEIWPEGTRPQGKEAVQSPFLRRGDLQEVTVLLDHRHLVPMLVYDLFCPSTGEWDNNHGRDYQLRLPPPPAPPAPKMVLEPLLEERLAGMDVVRKVQFFLGNGLELAGGVVREGEELTVILLTNTPAGTLLHWGLAKGGGEWILPDEGYWPEGSLAFDDKAVRSHFGEVDGCRELIIPLPDAGDFRALNCVLFEPVSGQWLKSGGRDMAIPLTEVPEGGGVIADLTERIIERETGKHGWTLMHRFNLCHDLINEAGTDRGTWALLYVWLRYSSLRQLEWQRNFNTKPKELAHAQDRLTGLLAECFVERREVRDIVRLMFTCIGPGGEGQRIRDEILHIMHRHHVKEVSGHFMEEWHQKLHNNTTPDDIVICEAYLAFLHSDGDLRVWWDTLNAGGVTRERLASYDRAIVTEPDFPPHIKWGLIHDFNEYLKLLKSVHSGTDFESSLNRGGHLLTGDELGRIENVQANLPHARTTLVRLLEELTSVRMRLNERLANTPHTADIRDGMYLDLALEDAFRLAVERSQESEQFASQVGALIPVALHHLRIAMGNAELDECAREWEWVSRLDISNAENALHAKAALDRLSRAVSDLMDGFYQLLQPRAEALGAGCDIDRWVIDLFSEEVVRGRPVFVLSLLLRHYDRQLRRVANLGDWQVVSSAAVSGTLLRVESLRAVQGRTFDEPTIVLADKVFGDEEPPAGMVGVITPASVDLVSHVAVRARNARLLFATCYDAERLGELAALVGKPVRLAVSASGDVIEGAGAAGGDDADGKPLARAEILRPTLSSRPLRMEEFAAGMVGGKSRHLRELSESLPEGVGVPRSVALPYGTFEAVLADEVNRAIAAELADLQGGLAVQPEETLAAIRAKVLDVVIPERLLGELREAMEASGLEWPADAELAARRIKEVWASKWNDRAYFSRRARGIGDNEVFMAVLIQEVISADYAFVLHTENPATGNADELYGELVLGLGETLVGNYPGRSLSFVSPKDKPAPEVKSFPSKSVGLFGRGLIFRSDSNAEDLAGYAGAGLYDSVLLETPEERRLSYAKDPLVWKEEFRTPFLKALTQVGVAIEESFGSAQDIEGAYVDGRLFVVQSRPQVG